MPVFEICSFLEKLSTMEKTRTQMQIMGKGCSTKWLSILTLLDSGSFHTNFTGTNWIGKRVLMSPQAEGQSSSASHHISLVISIEYSEHKEEKKRKKKLAHLEFELSSEVSWFSFLTLKRESRDVTFFTLMSVVKWDEFRPNVF